ncbi:TRAP transporter small permease [Siccibacter turicensis]|uniref:TRAP transporter small permease n=1 Tax=Siccibacter turicensis TaxID=357233 RepID=UPI00101F66C8|nr:TRAP transporter small permease [Siccibacter turicensis]
MSHWYLRWMDKLYMLAMVIAGLALLVMTIVIPIGIFSRYVLNRGESWPEPIAIICMVTFTFIGAAVSYRAGSHIAVNMLTDRLPATLQRLCARLVDLLMLVISALIFWYSYQLCLELWEQPVAEFPLLTSGESYLPLPVGSALLILFVVERLLFGSQESRPVVMIGNHS